MIYTMIKQTLIQKLGQQVKKKKYTAVVYDLEKETYVVIMADFTN